MKQTLESVVRGLVEDRLIDVYHSFPCRVQTFDAAYFRQYNPVTAADIVKLAMIRIHDRLQREGLKSPMILQVHDELVFDAYSTEVESLRELVKAEMESAFVLKVPLVADTGVGRTWLKAH